jgi:hypothetical protein
VERAVVRALESQDVYEPELLQAIDERLHERPVLIVAPVGSGSRELARVLARRGRASVVLDPGVAGGAYEPLVADALRQIVAGLIAPLEIVRLGDDDARANHARLLIAERCGPDTDELIAISQGASARGWSLERALSLGALPADARVVVLEAHRLGPESALWELRQIANDTPCEILLSTRPAHVSKLAGSEGAVFGNVHTAELPRPPVARWERVLAEHGYSLHAGDLEWLLESARGRPAIVISVLEHHERGRSIRAAWQRAAQAHAARAEDVRRLADAVHPYAPELLRAIATGAPPYSTIEGASSQRVARALSSLRDLDLIEQSQPRRWEIADPLLSAALLLRGTAVSRGRRVFLGSSYAAHEHVERIAEWLEEADLEPLIWRDSEVFSPGLPMMHRLLDLARSEVIAAVLVFTEDDFKAGGKTSSPADNLILEYGLFAGVLGLESTMAVLIGKPEMPADLMAIHIDLNKPLRAKEKLGTWARKLYARPTDQRGKPHMRHAVDDVRLFDTYVDAAVSLEDVRPDRAEILSHARDETLIPSRYLYENEVGANYWLDLCNDPHYTDFRNSLSFWSDIAAVFAGAIESETGHEFDFVSLGPGDGQKDAELIRAWTRDGESDVIYYPYDISLRMITRTVQEIRKIQGPIRVKAALADFDNLSQLKAICSARDTPNVISLLGNSLGNGSNELSFIRGLRAAMNSDDFLLLEVRLKHGSADPPVLDSPLAKRFYFSPLEHYLAIPFNVDKIRSRMLDSGLSQIRGTQSTLICYEDFQFENKRYSDVKLLCINEYDQDAFILAIERAGFECLVQKTDDAGRFLACLLRPS